MVDDTCVLLVMKLEKSRPRFSSKFQVCIETDLNTLLYIAEYTWSAKKVPSNIQGEGG